MGNATAAALMAARLVAGNDHTAADILGNAYKMAVREQVVSSPFISRQDQLLHDATTVPSFYRPFPGRVPQPVALAGGPDLYNYQSAPGYSRRPTECADFYNYQPTPGYSRTTDYFSSLSHQITPGFEASEPNYYPYLSDGGSWSSLSKYRNSSLSQLTTERSTFQAERFTYPPVRSTYPPEKSTFPPRMTTNPPYSYEKETWSHVTSPDLPADLQRHVSPPDLSPDLQRLDELMSQTEGLHITKSGSRFGSTLWNLGATNLCISNPTENDVFNPRFF